MSILVNKNTKLIIQGMISETEASRLAQAH